MEIGLAGAPLPLMSEADDRVAVRRHLEVVGQQAQGFRQQKRGQRSPARRRSSPANPNSPEGYLGDSD
jgi:hypothetical protein